MTAKPPIFLSPWEGHERFLLGCIFDLNLTTSSFPSSSYIQVLSEKEFGKWVGWFCMVGLHGGSPSSYGNRGTKALQVSSLFHVHGMKGKLIHFSLPNPYHHEMGISCLLSLGHCGEHWVSQMSFLCLWQYNIQVSHVKSGTRVLPPSPWLCHILAASQEHL